MIKSGWKMGIVVLIGIDLIALVVLLFSDQSMSPQVDNA